MRTEIALDDLLARYRPGRRESWDDEERDIRARVCCCCDQPGHYQEQLEAHVAEHGLEGMGPGVCLSGGGRVWDGHHRIIAARRLGIAAIPVEDPTDSAVPSEDDTA